jgi:hypothetical protein
MKKRTIEVVINNHFIEDGHTPPYEDNSMEKKVNTQKEARSRHSDFQ